MQVAATILGVAGTLARVARAGYGKTCVHQASIGA